MLIYTAFVSLDGVVEAPGGEPGYRNTGWTFAVDFLEEAYGLKAREQDEAGSMLLGRVSYQAFSAVWPQMVDEFPKYNAMPKYVVSRTLDDAAVTRGDGVFESILVRGGAPVNLDKHLARFARSAALMGLPEPGREHWTRATEEAVADFCRERGGEAGEAVEAKCTWTLTRGRETTGVPTAWLTVRPIGEDVLRQRRGCEVERVEAVRPVVLVGEVWDDDAGRARGERGTRRPRPAVVDDGAHLREQRVVRLVIDADDDAIRLARRTVELDERAHAESPARLGDDVDDAAR